MNNIVGFLEEGESWTTPRQVARLVLVEQVRENDSFGDSQIRNLVGDPLVEEDERTLAKWLRQGGIQKCKIFEGRSPAQGGDTSTRKLLNSIVVSSSNRQNQELDQLSLYLSRNTVGILNIHIFDIAHETELVLTLELQPKIGWASFAFLMGLVPTPLALSNVDANMQLSKGPEAFLSLLAMRFVGAVNRYLAWGMFGDYEEVSDELPYIRGRINFAQTMQNLSMGRIRFDLTFDHFSVDSELNRVIKQGLSIAHTILRRSDAQSTCAWIDRVVLNDFYEVGSFNWSDLRTRPGKHQENAREAWEDARYLINSVGPAPESPTDEVIAFIIPKTEQVIEESLLTALRQRWLPSDMQFGSYSLEYGGDSPREVEGYYQDALSNVSSADSNSVTSANPDLIVTVHALGTGRQPSLRDFVGDIKYKVLNKWSVDETDIFDIEERVSRARLRRSDEQQSVFFGRLYGMHNSVVFAFKEVRNLNLMPEELVAKWTWSNVLSTVLSGDFQGTPHTSLLPDFRIYTIFWPIVRNSELSDTDSQKRTLDLVGQAFNLVMLEIKGREAS